MTQHEAKQIKSFCEKQEITLATRVEEFDDGVFFVYLNETRSEWGILNDEVCVGLFYADILADLELNAPKGLIFEYMRDYLLCSNYSNKTNEEYIHISYRDYIGGKRYNPSPSNDPYFDNPDNIADIERGKQQIRDGNYRPWDEVKKELEW